MIESLHLPSRSESEEHRMLKSLAAGWAVERRLSLYAAEVRLPRSAYRADVAACTPRVIAPSAFTAVFECKASRADFLRDAAPETATATELSELTERLAELRALIAAHRPDLRRGEELFPAFDCWDLHGLKHATHDQLMRRLRAAQRKLHEGTKFAKMVRWRSASLLYAVTEPGVLHPWELPDGWGWLERSGAELVLRAKPCLQATTAAERVALLERIAAVTAVRESRRLGVKRPDWVEREPTKAPYSNCLRNAANCSLSSAMLCRNSATSASSRASRSFSARTASVAASGAGTAAPSAAGSGISPSSWA